MKRTIRSREELTCTSATYQPGWPRWLVTINSSLRGTGCVQVTSSRAEMEAMPLAQVFTKALELAEADQWLNKPSNGYTIK